jgi:ribonuclease P protein component
MIMGFPNCRAEHLSRACVARSWVPYRAWLVPRQPDGGSKRSVSDGSCQAVNGASNRPAWAITTGPAVRTSASLLNERCPVAVAPKPLWNRDEHGHEAHLSAVQDPPRPHARLSRAYEDPRWTRCHQRPARQRPQAFVAGLTAPLAPRQQQRQPRVVSVVQNPVRVARLKQSADFQRLLDTPIQQRSAHFAIHHVATEPSMPGSETAPPLNHNLSTGGAELCPDAVDDSTPILWLGCLVPKRHARRAVTRNLFKRQMRVAAERVSDRWPKGIALLRLRQPFVTSQFPSARSEVLRQAVRDELDQLVQRFVAAHRDPRPAGVVP